ncbi:AraC family ligand binding domain-containing protein [Pseudomonas sp. NFX15]|uniref:AraC family ligand binding domain-containing protein n=1 Tax=Pseudomonas sp. NFX15 TaxID=2816958 RepID=UPI003B8DBBAF
MSSKHIDLLDVSELPSAVYFRYADFDAHEYAAPHRHPWGTLEYAAHGVLHMDVAGSRFMSPPQYAVWVPPQIEHSFYSHQPVNYRAVCLAPRVCTDMGYSTGSAFIAMFQRQAGCTPEQYRRSHLENRKV